MARIKKKPKPPKAPPTRFTESKATFISGVDEKKVGIRKEDGDFLFMKIVHSWVEITTEWNDKIKFTKCNRGSRFEDSRGGTLDDREVQSELERLLPASEVRRAYWMLVWNG